MRIFISYRRDDVDVVSRVRDRLVQRGHQVFQDIDTIRPGERFGQQTFGELDAAEVVLFVIGPTWLRQVQDPSKPDWIRQEVEHVLSRAPLPRIFPVLVRGAELPSDDLLPQGMRDLIAYQAMPIPSGPAFDYHVERLLMAIEPSAKRMRPSWRGALAGAALLSLGGLGAFAWSTRPQDKVETQTSVEALTAAIEQPAAAGGPPEPSVQQQVEPVAEVAPPEKEEKKVVIKPPRPPVQPPPARGEPCVSGPTRCAPGLLCAADDARCHSAAESCPTGLQGPCQPGRYVVEGSSLACKSFQSPASEVCDQSDNDCDGKSDEAITAHEACNERDDDCDGKVDETCIQIVAAEYGVNCGIARDRANFVQAVRAQCANRSGCTYSFDWSTWGGDPAPSMCAKEIAIRYRCGPSGEEKPLSPLHRKTPQTIDLSCP